MTTNQKIEYLNVLINMSDKTNNLLEDLLLWARIQMNTMDFKASKIKLDTIIYNTIHTTEERAKEKDIDVIKNIDPEISIKANEESITTVCRNLLSNAIKFSHKKSKIQIEAIADIENNMVNISFTDYGMGIPADSIHKLFKIENYFFDTWN